MTRAGLIALAVFIIATGLLFSLNPRTQQKLSAAVLQAVAPVFSTGSSVKTRVQAYTTGVKSLAELEDDNKRLKIFIADVASGQVKQVTLGDHYEHSIEWSPKGDEILFASNRN